MANFFEAVKETGFAKPVDGYIYRIGETQLEFWDNHKWCKSNVGVAALFREFEPCEDPVPKPPREWWIDDHECVWTKDEMIKHGYPFDKFIHVREVQE